MQSVTYLSPQLVEDLQRAKSRGRRIDDLVENLEHISLSGLSEYICLRKYLPGIPELPARLRKCSLLALWDRATKDPYQTNGRSDAGFHLITNPQDIEGEKWKLFQLQFDQSARSIGMGNAIAPALSVAFSEMVENVLIHAGPCQHAFAGYEKMSNSITFSVCDSGMGVKKSLESHQAYSNIESHSLALGMALTDGISRFGPGKGGFGFRSIFKALTEQWGTLRFRSGEASIQMDGQSLTHDKGEIRFVPFLPGFQVSVTCRTSARAYNQI